LIVAIPALICHAYLTRRARRYLTALEADSVLLSQLGQIHQSDKRDADYA